MIERIKVRKKETSKHREKKGQKKRWEHIEKGERDREIKKERAFYLL